MSEMKLSSQEEQQFKNAVSDYLNKHDLNLLFSQMMMHLHIDKPKDPIAYLHQFLKKHKDNYRKSFRRVFLIGQPLSQYNQVASDLNARGFTDMEVITMQQLLLQAKASSVIDTSDLDIPTAVFTGKELCTLLRMFTDSRESVIRNGFILSGFPQTREQALSLQEEGIFPDHLFVLEFKDSGEYERRLKAVEYDKNIQLMFSHYEKNKLGLLNTFDNNITTLIDAGLPITTILSKISDILQGKTTSPPLKIIIMGPPAGGKGTASEVIKEQYGVIHLSTGDILRAEIRGKTELGVTAQSFMDKGDLVPDDLIINMISRRLKEPDCTEKGWLLDGFPRTASQAQFMQEAGIRANAVLLLECPDDTVIERISGRRSDPVTGTVYHIKYNPPPTEEIAQRLVQRSDDTEDKLKIRLGNYYAQVNSMLQYFPGIVYRINAAISMNEVASSVLTVLSKVQT